MQSSIEYQASNHAESLKRKFEKILNIIFLGEGDSHV